MLSRREIDNFLDNMMSFIVANFVATFILAITVFNRPIETALLISFIGPILLIGISAGYLLVWYLYRLVKNKRSKNV